MRTLLMALMIGANTATATPTIADGSRLVLKDFSIQPPTGWEVITDYPHTTLLLQTPATHGHYQSTLQVMRFNEPKYIDESVAKTFADEIQKNFSAASGSVSHYEITKTMLAKTQKATPGILFYAKFELDQKPMMQAHFLVSSATDHYLLTFTDVAENFQGDTSNTHFALAWSTMTSIELNSAGPVPWTQQPTFWFGLLISVLGLGLVIVLIQRRRHHTVDLDTLDDVDINDSDNDEADPMIVHDNLDEGDPSKKDDNDISSGEWKF